MCKILYLWHYKKTNNYDHSLNVDFAQAIAHYPGIELMGYGLDFFDGYPNLAPKQYQPNITLEDIYKEFKFDVILANTKGRMFKYYNPHKNEQSETWLPTDFNTWNKTPKLAVEEDYHYEVDDSWYREMNFDLILQRHYSQSLRQDKVPMQFFPFSVDTSFFNPWRTEVPYKDKVLPLLHQSKRLNQVAFIGHYGDKAYQYRFNACKSLMKENLCVSFSSEEPGNKRKTGGEYLQVLRQYLGYVSCGSTYEICAAKNLEIISSGGVLFTNKFLGLDLLLPENSYVTYKNDMSDVVEKARRIINEPEYVRELVNNGRKVILEKHTHEIRIKELLHIIYRLT